MVLTGGWHEEEILVTVRAAPEPSRAHRETSCVAGITKSGLPIRLFPIPARDLDERQQFSKYNVIRARVRKASDPRPESHNVDLESIVVLRKIGTEKRWAARNEMVTPFRIAGSVEELEQLWEESGGRLSETPSLALIRPKSIDRFLIRRRGATDWSEEERQKLERRGLFEQKRVPLEFIPFKFYYQFHCDHANCTGHNFQILDWEVSEAYRKWSKINPEKWREDMQAKFMKDLAKTKDLQFFLGTISQHPQIWTTIGIYYPPKPLEMMGMKPMF